MQYILNYVLFNFFLVYEKTDQVQIAFDEDHIDAKIFIPNLSNDFFEKSKPYDITRVGYKIVEEERVPFLFTSSEKEPFKIQNGKVVFNDDIISSAFYFLSGRQELSAPKDHLSRFIYEESIQRQLGITHLPVVNYYFNLLASAIELAYGIKLKNKLHPKGSFITSVTHDVDIWQNTWKNELKIGIKTLNIIQIVKSCLSLIDQSHLGSGFSKIRQLQEKYKFKSTYFFLPRKGKYMNLDNADYNIEAYKYQRIIKQLKAEGNEIGLHGSFESSFDDAVFHADKNKIQQETIYNRFHYLMFDIEKTPQLLEKQGIRYDSTLGFNSTPGFRNGTSYPFYLYNHGQKQATSVIEIPLAIMDVSMFSKDYLACKTADEGFNKIEPILKQIKKTGGYLVLNWHNNYFSEVDYFEYQELIERILSFSINNGSIMETVAINTR